jgi:glycine reductase complex component B subunit alpha and beta
MKLELDIVHINDIKFSEKSAIANGVLQVNRSELQDILQKDPRLSRVDIELASPGERCRILQVCDVVEPRAKNRGDGADFPGAIGKQGTVGDGSTCVLRGAAVVTSLHTRAVEGAGDRDPNGEIIDMTGPAADLSVYGQTHNVVLLPMPAENVSQQDYMMGAKIAGLKTAVYLAKLGRDLSPDETQVFENVLLSGYQKGVEDLPRVAYVFQVMATQQGVVPHEPILYGNNVDKIVPTVLHPNEILDGALVSPFRAWGMDTYSIQNHPIIQEIYRRHGIELNFTGVIVVVASENISENQRSAIMASNLAKWVLGADGIILTKSGGGAPEVPMAMIAQRCEQLGIKTTIALWHIPVDTNDTRGGLVVFNMPELDAIVSAGTPWQRVKLPSVERIIGTPVERPEATPVVGEIERMLRWIRGSQDQVGGGRLRGIEY